MGKEKLIRAQSYRWIVFWILAVGYLLVYFHRLAPAVVAAEMMREFRAGAGLLGFLGAAYFYAYAVMQLPAGLLSDSWGPRKTISFFFGLAFVGSLTLGMATNVFWAIVGRTLVGMGVSMLFVSTMKVLAEWFRVGEFALMTGLLMAMGGLGSLSAAVPWALVSSWIGWRNSFVLVGIITLGLAILVWLVVRDRPSDLGWGSPLESADVNPQGISLPDAMKQVMGCAAFWSLASWFFFDAAIFFAFVGLWGGPYLMQIYGFSKAQAGVILSMPSIGMIIGGPLLGFASDHLFHARKPVLVLSSLGLLIITAFFAFFTKDLPTIALYMICFCLGVFAFGATTVAYTTNKELFPVQIAGTASGLVNFFPFAGGAVLQPLFGYILEAKTKGQAALMVQGYQQAFLVVFLFAIAAFASTLFIRETLKNR